MLQACCIWCDQIHTKLQSDVSKFDPLDTKISEVNRKQLSSDM
jgi:hypothetical protein